MKVLFVGNANSFLLINLASTLKKHYPGLQIDILSNERIKDSGLNSPFDTIFQIASESRWKNVKYLKVIWYAIQLKRLLATIPEDYKAIHIFYISSIYRLVWPFLKRKGKKIILSVFGSEFYRSGKAIKRMQRQLIIDADWVTAANTQTLNDFCGYFSVPAQKQTICRFGLSVIDEMQTVTEAEINAFRQTHQITNKHIIACGYNASRNQNLEKIIQQLATIKEHLNQSVLFFQLPGTENELYRQTLESLLKHNQLNYRFFIHPFTNHELAVYRKAVDVMIQVQNTDQLSGAMSEHISAGIPVITGAWLPYKILDDEGIRLFKINRFEELASVLLNAMEKGLTCDQQQQNTRKINQLCQWQNTITHWYNLYQ
ncbi:MAG: glycosyltransferase [Sediminibacterium sp.]|nr:glycosyltransferase [Sediminibacterium sp.]